MEENSQTAGKIWRRKLAAYFLIAGIVLIIIGVIAGISKDMCSIMLFSVGIISVLLAALLEFRKK